MRFDLLIKGGEAVDDAAGLSGRRDVAVNGDRIAAVDREIPAEHYQAVAELIAYVWRLSKAAGAGAR